MCQFFTGSGAGHCRSVGGVVRFKDRRWLNSLRERTEIIHPSYTYCTSYNNTYSTIRVASKSTQSSYFFVVRDYLTGRLRRGASYHLGWFGPIRVIVATDPHHYYVAGVITKRTQLDAGAGGWN